MRFGKILATVSIAATTAFGLTTPAFAATSGAPDGHRSHCATQLMTFNLHHGSSNFTETQGPWLYVNEVFTYHGQTFTIASVNHGGFLGHDHFTVDNTDGHLVVNGGPSIWHGEAHVLACTR